MAGTRKHEVALGWAGIDEGPRARARSEPNVRASSSGRVGAAPARASSSGAARTNGAPDVARSSSSPEIASAPSTQTRRPVTPAARKRPRGPRDERAQIEKLAALAWKLQAHTEALQRYIAELAETADDEDLDVDIEVKDDLFEDEATKKDYPAPEPCNRCGARPGDAHRLDCPRSKTIALIVPDRPMSVPERPPVVEAKTDSWLHRLWRSLTIS